MSEMIETLTKHLTRLALDEVALLKQDGASDEDIIAHVTQNNAARVEGLLTDLQAYIADLERQAGVTPAV